MAAAGFYNRTGICPSPSCAHGIHGCGKSLSREGSFTRTQVQLEFKLSTCLGSRLLSSDTLPLGLNSDDGPPTAGLDPWAQNESDRTKRGQMTTASIQASVQMGRETSAAIQSWTWQTESEAAPPQKERLSLEASPLTLQGNERDQPALCSQGDVKLPCPCQMHSLP